MVRHRVYIVDVLMKLGVEQKHGGCVAASQNSGAGRPPKQLSRPARRNGGPCASMKRWVNAQNRSPAA